MIYSYYCNIVNAVINRIVYVPAEEKVQSLSKLTRVDPSLRYRKIIWSRLEWALDYFSTASFTFINANPGIANCFLMNKAIWVFNNVLI